MATLLTSSFLSSVSSLRCHSTSSRSSDSSAAPLRIECSSRPQKKATAHHVKTRPKKHNPYDKNRRGPTYYPKLPKPPPIWGLDTSDFDTQLQSEAPADESSSSS